MVALVGESGCGKTTTAQTVMRMLDAEAGSIRFRGREIAPLSQRALRPLRREMQMIFQDPYESLDPRFTRAGHRSRSRWSSTASPAARRSARRRCARRWSGPG